MNKENINKRKLINDSAFYVPKKPGSRNLDPRFGVPKKPGSRNLDPGFYISKKKNK